MQRYSITEQVCDFSFHMIFYLRFYANPIQSYIMRTRYSTFAKSMNREENKLNV